MSNSNLNGRLLEYFIVEEILRMNEKCSVDEQTLLDQERDKIKIDRVSQGLKEKFKYASLAIYDWLARKSTFAKVERLPDSAGRNGDVTDVRIWDHNHTEINLSIKNNHRAIKHQRPGSLIQQLGFPKGSHHDKRFRKSLHKIYEQFHSVLEEPNPVYFKEVEDLKYPLIYTPVCALISNTLNLFADSTTVSSNFQEFLIGNRGFFKLMVMDSVIEILDFHNVKPSSYMTSKSSENYVYVDFNNGVKVNMRLHTASSRITENISLKFDSHLDRSTKLPYSTISLG